MDGSHPRHRSGIVDDLPGLYVVGLTFLHAVSSGMVHGVRRDATRVVDDIAVRRASGTVLPAPVTSNALVV